MGSQLDVWIDLDRQIAVEGPSSTNRATLKGFQGDTLNLVLHGLRLNYGSSLDTPYDTASIEWSTLKAGILKIDAAPLAGSFKVQVGDGGAAVKTAALPFNISKSDFAAAINALANVVDAGGVNVALGGAANIYRLQWLTPGNVLTIAIVENTLTPKTFDRVTVDDDTPGKVEVKLMQAPVAFTDQFSLPLPPPVTVSSVVPGTANRNAVQRLTVPAHAVGQFAFKTQGRGLIAVDGITATIIAATLNQPFVDANANDIRFTVSQSSSTTLASTFDITFVGAYAASAQDTLAVDMFDQVEIDTPTAALPLTAVGVEDALDGAPSVVLRFEIVTRDVNGQEFTLCQEDFTIINDGLDAPMALNVPDWLVSAQQAAAQDLDPAQPIISGTLSYRGSLGTVGDPVDGTAGKTWTINHGLGTSFPFPIVYPGVGRRRLKPGSEYDWEEVDENTCKITFTNAPDPGAYQIMVVSFEAATVLNNHEHPWTQIYRDNGDGTKTYLPAIIEALENNLPDDWPNVPGNKIADGSISASKLDLVSLVNALKASGDFLAALQYLTSDQTIANKIAASLQNSSAFLSTLQSLITNSTIVNALAPALLASAGMQDSLRTLLIDIIQGGAASLNGGVLIALPDHDILYPPLVGTAVPPLPAAAISILDVFTVNTGTDVLSFNAPHGLKVNALVRVATTGTLPVGLSVDTDYYVKAVASTTALSLTKTKGGALVDITSSGTGEQYLIPQYSSVLPTAADAPGQLYGVQGSAFVRPNKRKVFSEGDLIFSNGSDWFRALIDGENVYDADAEVQLFSVNLTEALLAPGSQFSVLDSFTLGMTGANCEGFYVLELRRGTLTKDTGASNLKAEDWDETIISIEVTVTDSEVTHSIGYRLTRANDGSITATKNLYGVESAAPAPVGHPLQLPMVVQARLTHADTTNVKRPTGQFHIKQTSQTASVVRS